MKLLDNFKKIYTNSLIKNIGYTIPANGRSAKSLKECKLVPTWEIKAKSLDSLENIIENNVQNLIKDSGLDPINSECLMVIKEKTFKYQDEYITELGLSIGKFI